MVSSLYKLNNNQHNHGTIHDVLSVIVIMTTIFFITFLKPHRLYKRIMSWFFNLSFEWKGTDWKIYHILGLFVFCCILFLFVLKMQLEIYAAPGVTENYERKLFRLSYKWLIESELWMTSIIIFELAAVYFLSTMGDQKRLYEEELRKLNYKDEEIKKIENNY